MCRSIAIVLGVALVSALTSACGGSGSGPSGPSEPGRDATIAPLDAGPPWGPPGLDAGVQLAETPPPPISGGTLAVSADGAWIVAADPELDAVFVVDVATPALAATVTLEPGDEPGRVALDGAGRAHVVLRRGGAIADVDLATGTLVARRAVCASPRGIAWRASDDTLHVACAEGLLVSLPAAGGAATRVLRVSDDLRDVVVHGDELWVTRFRAATVLRVDASGAIAAEIVPASIEAEPVMRVTQPGPFVPHVAWRTVPTPEGGALILHQRATSAEFFAEAGYGGLDCGMAIVHGAATEAGPDGTVTRSSSPLANVVLGVDVAISPDGARIAVAAPANAYPRESPAVPLTISRESRDVLVYERAALATPDGPARCVDAFSIPLLAEGGAAIAVAFLPGGRLVAQTRAPARIVIEGTAPPAVGPAIDLPGGDTFDTGHALFHGRASGGIACASCHPEGGDDAHTWRFAEMGPRRTQTMRGGLLDTAPFHWDGDMVDFSTLVHRVFEGRMGGAIHHPDEIAAFARWMDALPALPRPAPVDADAALRGRALFHDATVACATCHAGENLTTSVTVDVGTGRPLQVPTLLGIAYRAPYMHDGCAPTLRERFTDPVCGGGDAHGRTSTLTSAQIDDLVAYLRTL